MMQYDLQFSSKDIFLQIFVMRKLKALKNSKTFTISKLLDPI